MGESEVLSVHLREAKASQLHKFPKEPRNQSFRAEAISGPAARWFASLKLVKFLGQIKKLIFENIHSE